jgi:hypothetical protein
METIKKKRGRKPKNFQQNEKETVVEKKKRGRKKKYEIENFEKILNRNEENNFNIVSICHTSNKCWVTFRARATTSSSTALNSCAH